MCIIRFTVTQSSADWGLSREKRYRNRSERETDSETQRETPRQTGMTAEWKKLLPVLVHDFSQNITHLLLKVLL